ncbi:MAG: mycothiol synthase [Actinomycetes bacterium]
MTLTVSTVEHLDPAELSGVISLIEHVTSADGLHPLSEHVYLHLRHGGDDGGRHVLVRDDSSVIVGYAHLDCTDMVQGPSAELAVEPAARREGVGRLIISTLLELTDGQGLRLWAHGEQAAAARLARSMGFENSRVLWQMRRSLFAPISAAALPEGCTIRAFEPGVDDDAWLRINARAFAELPDQGGWTLDDLHRRMAEPWFSAAGFLILECDGKVVGFHWTKVHGRRSGGGHDHDAIGEVYVVGVDPDHAGRGLGRALTLAGLHHLRGLGLSQAMLYVDASNTSAIRLYEGLGFSRWDTDVLYRHRAVAER